MKNVFLVLLFFCFLVFQNAVNGQSIASAETQTLDGSAPANEVSPQRKEIKEFKYSLGEFVTTSSDEELHYIKVEITIEFEGQSEEPIAKNREKLRDAANTLLMKITIQQARKDYIDHLLHKDMQMKFQEILDEFAPKLIKINRVLIPTFLVN